MATVGVKHSKVVTIPDDPNYPVGSDEWNDFHTVTGLENVDNTSDANKPVSTATQTALNLKAPLASPALTGIPTAPTATANNNTTQIATTAYVDAAGALKAPLASPALSGTPTTPTATAGTSTTQIASTAFVSTAITNLVGGAPGALDTLKELADAINDDASYAATITTALALKAPLASPALTGAPTAPTASAGDNSTKLATTAYADAIGALKAPLASPALTGTPTAPTAALGTNTTQLATTAFVLANAASAAALPTRFWQGFQHSNNVTTPNTKIDISAGSCRDSTDALNIVVAGGTIDLTTVGANGLDTGSLAANSKLYTFAISQAAGTPTAYLASLSPTAPTLPASYTKFRRIGFAKTAAGAATVIAFHHRNNRWSWDSSPRDVSTGATVGTSFVTSASLSVPNVEGVIAKMAVTFFNAATITAFVMPTFVPDTVGNGWALNDGTTAGGTFPVEVQVDSSGCIKYRATAASSTIVIDTAGWIDDL